MLDNDSVGFNYMERNITEEEIQGIKKDVRQKLVHSIIALIAFVIVSYILVRVGPSLYHNVLENISLPRGTKRYSKYLLVPFIAAVVVVVRLLTYGAGTLVKSIEILTYVKDARVIEVLVPEIKDKSTAKKGYRYYADICMYVNGQPQAIEVPILTNSIKYIRWQKKGKLYFVHSSFYMLGKIDM